MMSAIKKAFVHTVYFWLKEANPENLAKLKEGVLTLGKIETILEGFVGTPASTRRPVIDHSYDLALTFIFYNKEDQDIYQDHPIHQAFVDNYKHLWSKVLVYDAES